MSLDAKYDHFYQADAARAAHSDVVMRGWPRDRVQAIVHLPLQGDAILDVGCGDGRLLYQFRHRFSRLVGLEYSASRLAAATGQEDGSGVGIGAQRAGDDVQVAGEGAADRRAEAGELFGGHDQRLEGAFAVAGVQREQAARHHRRGGGAVAAR